MTEEKEKRKQYSHHRNPDQTCISISIDKVMLNMLDEAAAKSGRNRSNFVRWVLRRSLHTYAE